MNHNMKLAIVVDEVSQDFEKACEIIHQQGYKYVELHHIFGKTVEMCSDEEIACAKKVLGQYELVPLVLSSTLFLVCPLYDTDEITSFGEHFKCVKGTKNIHFEALKRTLEIAKQLQILTVRMFPFRAPDNANRVIIGGKEDQREIQKTLQIIDEIVEGSGITIVLENCPYSHLPKGTMTYDVLANQCYRNIRMLWDPANSYRAEKHRVPIEYLALPIYDELTRVYRMIHHVHLKNYHYDSTKTKPFVHVGLDKGDIDIKKILQLLKDYHYEGVISLEPEVNLEETLQSMKHAKEIMNEI